VVSEDAEVVTLGEIIINKLMNKQKVRRIYFAVIVHTSFQLLERDRVSRSVHIGLMFAPSTACVGLIIGFVAFISEFLSVTAVR
jgi:hypothetical protein